MRLSLRRLLGALAVGVLLAAPASAARQVGEIDVPPASVAFDAVILRPCGLIATGVGAAFAIPAAAFTALVRPQEIHKPISFLVLRPAKYTFVDPLGTH
jgi:hypothetical protein